MKSKIKFLGYVVGIAISSIVLGLSLQLVHAWVEPNMSAPNANIGAPITTGGATQNKSGQLNITGGGVYGSGGLGFGFHSLNSKSDGWLYVGDQAGGIYGGRGIAMGSLWADNVAYAPIVYDINNSAYYLDPNSTSRLNYGVFDNLYAYGWMQATWYPDANDNNYYVDPNGTSSLATVYANDVYLRNAGRWASQATGDNLGNHSATSALNMNWNAINNSGTITATSITDANNGGYYVDPNGTSRMNYIVADNTYTYGTENVADIYIRNAGKWASSLGGGTAVLNCTTKTAYGNSGILNVNCDSGYSATGGGCSAITGSPLASYPNSSNGWRCSNPSIGYVYAVCCKVN